MNGQQFPHTTHELAKLGSYRRDHTCVLFSTPYLYLRLIEDFASNAVH